MAARADPSPGPFTRRYQRIHRFSPIPTSAICFRSHEMRVTTLSHLVQKRTSMTLKEILNFVLLVIGLILIVLGILGPVDYIIIILGVLFIIVAIYNLRREKIL